MSATSRLLGVLLCALAPTPALACGGFFCSTVPIDQNQEGILMAQTGQGTWETHVQIGFQGAADEFSWVVPVPGIPTLSVGTDETFRQLGWRTAPTFQVQTAAHECEDWSWDWYGWDDDGASGPLTGAAADADGVGNSVEVLSESVVGTYSATVVTAHTADDLVAWFDCNGFQVAGGSIDRIQTYLDDGMNFLALKLASGATSGTLTPIVMETDTMCPFVPLVLTGAAAQPNLKLNVWVLGEGTAVSTNWAHVQVDPARIPWEEYQYWWGGGMTSWERLVGHAVDEAGGNAVVTEYSGPPDMMREAIYREGRFDTDRLRAQTQPWDFVNEMLRQGFPRDAVAQGILRTHIPMPQALIDQGVAESTFYNNLWSFRNQLGPFDPDATVDDIELLVIEPLEDAQALFDDPRPGRVLTRMTSIVSPWEMNSDPTFAVIPPGTGDAQSVPQVRQATASYYGDAVEETCWDLPKVVSTSIGMHQITQQTDHPLLPAGLPDCQTLPAALNVVRYDEDGNGVLVSDNRALLDTLAPLSMCTWSTTVPALPTTPPQSWKGDGPLLPSQERDPAVCAAFEGTTEIVQPGLEDPGNGHFPTVNDASAVLLSADTEGNAGPGCACASGGSSGTSAGLVLLGILGLRRRRDRSAPTASGIAVLAALGLATGCTPAPESTDGHVAAHEVISPNAGDLHAWQATLRSAGVGTAVLVDQQASEARHRSRVAMTNRTRAGDPELGTRALEARIAHCDAAGEPMLLEVDLRPAHVQLALEQTLRDHPDAIVVLARFGGLFTQLDRLEALLRRYPNLYVDLGVGPDPVPFLRLVEANPDRVRSFFLEWHPRLLWGTGSLVDADLDRVRQRIELDLSLYAGDRVEWKGHAQPGLMLPIEISDAILGDNARKVYGL